MTPSCRTCGHFTGTTPALFVIGSRKSGTTSMAHLLTRHAQIQPPQCTRRVLSLPVWLRRTVCIWNKEVRYYTRAATKVDSCWYASLYECDGRIGLDASPDYLIMSDRSIRLLRQHVPTAKLIALLRNPVDRFYSAFNMAHNQARKHAKQPLFVYKDFVKQLDDMLNCAPDDCISRPLVATFVTFGMYHRHLSRWLRVFPRHQFFIEDAQTFYDNPIRVANDAFRWMGLPPLRDVPLESILPISKRNSGREWTSTYTSHVRGPERHKLAEFYRPYNEALFELIDRRFPWNGNRTR